MAFKCYINIKRSYSCDGSSILFAPSISIPLRQDTDRRRTFPHMWGEGCENDSAAQHHFQYRTFNKLSLFTKWPQTGHLVEKMDSSSEHGCAHTGHIMSFLFSLSVLCSGGRHLKNKSHWTHLQLLKNVNGKAEHPCHTTPSLIAFSSCLIHISSSSPRSLLLLSFYLHLLSPVIVTVRSYFSSLLTISLSFLLSLRNQMCSLYDLFICRDWGWESLLQAECTLPEFKWLSILPTIIPYANEFPLFI